MIAGLLLFTLFIMVYVVIADIITVLFRLTGLTKEKARFQVISLLTNSGFTTRESEVITESKVRRRLAKATMLFGYAFTVTIVSTAVNIVLQLSTQMIENALMKFGIMGAVFICFFILRSIKSVKAVFDRGIEKLGNRLLYGGKTNAVVLLDDYGATVVAQILLNVVPEPLREKKISESGLKSDHNIMVMLVKHADGKLEQAGAATVLEENELVVVLGAMKSIREVFSVKTG